MTDDTAPEIYPQYCFHLSPTINRWCHFRITDVLALKSHRGFEGQDVYFHLNHPIKWVRICGVVVAVDERETKRFYTIDDGSGATIECVVKVAPPAALGTDAAGTGMNSKSNRDSDTVPAVDAPIDVGHVLDVKGSVTTFRTSRQVYAEKIVHLRSTEQEVVFWEKVAQLRRDVLSKPWVLDRREVKRCRMEEEGGHTSRRHKDSGERSRRKQADSARVRKTRVNDEGERNPRPGESESKSTHEPPLAKRPKRETGLEKRRLAKPVMRLIPVMGNYDALGL